MQPAITVDAYCVRLRDALGLVPRVVVKGRVESPSVASSGHCYFDLCGETGRVPCVIWQGQGEVAEAGSAVALVETIDFYAPGGKCRAVVSRIAGSDADEVQARERLLARLQKAGDLARPRRPAPDVLGHLCVVTSLGSAAWHDVISGVRQQWPGLRTTVIDSLVQGQSAPGRIAAALAHAARLQPCADLVVLARGGGSAGDLSPFDSEAVARAILSLREAGVPVVSAVGHESDHTVADAVADARAKTPTAAVDLAIPCSLCARREALDALQKELGTTLQHAIRRCAASLSMHELRLHSAKGIESCRVALSNARERAGSALERVLSAADLGAAKTSVADAFGQAIRRHAFALASAREALDAVSRSSFGRRVVTASGERPVRCLRDAALGEVLHVRLDDGILEVEVKRLRRDEVL